MTELILENVLADYTAEEVVALLSIFVFVEKTDSQPGTIVLVITRLDETCREVWDAARVIGDSELFQKMEDAQGLIKRDSERLNMTLLGYLADPAFTPVVFAASLVSNFALMAVKLMFTML